MTEVIYPLSHWEQSLAQLPPEVVLACAQNFDHEAPGYGIYCLSDGTVAMGLRRTFGMPVIHHSFSSYFALVRMAVHRGCSYLDDDQMREACRFPDERGYRAFCVTGTEAVVLSPTERDELAVAVIPDLCRRLPDECDLFREADGPSELLQWSEFGLLRAEDIEPEVVDACRMSLKKDVLEDLDHLLSAAANWCEAQRQESPEDFK